MVALAAGVLLPACGAAERVNDRVNPEVPLWYNRPSGALRVVLRRPVTAQSRTVGEDYERGRAEIDWLGNRVFLGSADRGFYALRASDGSTIWRFETLAVVQSEPLYDPELDVVYFGSHDGALYAVRAADGHLIFRYNSGAEVSRRPVVVGDTVYFANAADQLFAIDRRTGKTRWQVQRTSALGMEIAGHAGPTYDRGKIYLAFSDGHVVAYDAATGTEAWTPVDLSADAEQAAGGEAPRYLDVDTTPVVGEIEDGPRVVFVASYAGGVYALDADTGARVWANEQATGVTDLLSWVEPAHAPSPDGPYAGGPQVPERRLLVASSASTGLWGLDPNNGREVWRNKLPDGGVTAPVSVAGALLVGTSRYGLFLLSPLNGRRIDGLDAGTGFSMTPAAFGQRAFVMSNAGVLLGLSVEPPVLAGSRRSAFARGSDWNWLR